MSLLNSEITDVPNLGPFYAKRFERLGVKTLFDLVTYAPRLYEERKQTVAIRDVRLGEKNGIVGKVLDARVITRRKRMLIVTLADGTGLVTLRFFHFYPNQIKQFAEGREVYAFGEVRLVGGNLEMMHPEFQFVEHDEAVEHYAIYPLSEGLTQARLRGFIESALVKVKREAEQQVLPQSILTLVEQHAPGFNFYQALDYLHFPPKEADFLALNAGKHPAQLRLIFEELLAHRLAVKPLVQEQQAKAVRIDSLKLDALVQSLPFCLTTEQNQVLSEIFDDLQHRKPMQRLLQGDVGSGKTIVALLAAFVVIQNQMQVALMAPTEILAEQLYAKACELFEPLGIQVACLLGKMTAKAKREVRQVAEAGTINLLIGTHALIQDEVRFKDLGLIIVDEQHRFGVGQRFALHQKAEAGIVPHQLIMSATPIPRTLAMTLYADLDISNIRELPVGRKPIETVLISDLRRDEVIARLQNLLQHGEQAYWVCPLIEESDVLELKAANETAEYLRTVLPGVEMALLHGRMKGKEKTAIMQDFKEGKIKLLIATTVVEVGVDVPNASIMIIENPERMGLSQLHQLRGRVGRGHKQSFCVLLYKGPLNEIAMQRLAMLRHSHSGFDLAEEDLRLRGPGEFLGTRQTGGLSFRFASLIRDQYLLSAVHEAAKCMQADYPTEAQDLVDKWFSLGTEFVKV